MKRHKWINFNNTFSKPKILFWHVINVKKYIENFIFFLLHKVFEIQYVFYTYRTSQFGVATCQVLTSHLTSGSCMDRAAWIIRGQLVPQILLSVVTLALLYFTAHRTRRNISPVTGPRMAVITRNKVHAATTWMSLENIMLSERSQTRKDKCYMNPFIGNVQNR